MDSEVKIKIFTHGFGEYIENRMHEAFLLWKEIENRLTRFSPDSELSLLNKKSRSTFVKVSPLLFYPLEYALTLAVKTKGAFDPTVACFLDAYGYDQKLSFRKDENMLRILKNRRKDYTDISLKKDPFEVKKSPLTKIDLGGIAKGYSLDLIGKFLDCYDNFCLEAGGDILVKGLNQEGKPWKIGVENPFKTGEYVGVFHLYNQAMATSSGLKRKGKDWHHIIDPVSGDCPTEIVSATVIADKGITADSYATTVMVLGKEKGTAFLQAENLKGLLVLQNGETVKVGM